MILAICIVVLLLINMVFATKLFIDINELQLRYLARKSHCGAIPIQFALNEPECVNKLLDSMNITNVRIASVNILRDRKAISMQE